MRLTSLINRSDLHSFSPCLEYERTALGFAIITKNHFSLLHRMIQDIERSWQLQKGRYAAMWFAWIFRQLKLMWDGVYPVSVYTTSHNRKKAYNCLWARLWGWEGWNDLLSSSGPITAGEQGITSCCLVDPPLLSCFDHVCLLWPNLNYF